MKTANFTMRAAGAAMVVALGAIAAPVTNGADNAGFTKIYLIHFSHTDIGFTDQPAVCRELYRRYLDVALDAIMDSTSGPAENRFFWTAESTIAVRDWWEETSEPRRNDFVKAVQHGQLDIAALPFNQTPFLDAAQWQEMLNWLPEDLAKQVKPKVALQCDVNGFPRAGAMALLDRGIRHLFMCINPDSGGPPFAPPTAFWWKMPDNRRLFVWLNTSYTMGYFLFEPNEWRRGPVPRASDTRYRPPRAGDFLRADESSVLAAHAFCMGKLRELRRGGYSHKVFAATMTSQWRMDNDPPFPPLAEFVAAWNRLGLKPELVFTTASKAMDALEKELGPNAPEHSGEFTDWWANGTASAPREVAASRMAKRLLAAAQSPLWGEPDSRTTSRISELYRDLCLFDEHTWGSSLSVAAPDALDTRAQFTEKALMAYRPMAQAEWLLSQRARLRWASGPPGLIVGNPSSQPYTGWVEMPATALRDDFKSVTDLDRDGRTRSPSEPRPIFFEPGIEPWGRPQTTNDLTRENRAATFPDNAPRKRARFWIENLPGHDFRVLHLARESAEPAARKSSAKIELDAEGWPVSASWSGMPQPLFTNAPGDLIAIKINAFAPRWAIADMVYAGDEKARTDLRRKYVEETKTRPEGRAALEETPYTFRYSQWLQHPRLRWCVRTIELWKESPRARVTIRFDRLSSPAPEILYALFPLPCGGTLPRLSSGGMPFTPFEDHLPGTCRDYFAFDGWADYSTPQGHWLWVSRDAPLLTFDSPQVWSRRKDAPANPSRLLAILFNNFWYTNFVADEDGVMEFQFDLTWHPENDSSDQVQQTGESAFIEPVVLINPELKEDPRMIRRVYTP